MKKKTICLAGLIMVMMVCLTIYFQPMSLSDSISETGWIHITITEMNVQDGDPHMDFTDYNDMTEEQKGRMVALLENYPYRRSFHTIFSDGSISGLGDKMLSIFVYQDTELIHSIAVSSEGQVAIDDRTYEMKHAELFIEQIESICNQQKQGLQSTE